MSLLVLDVPPPPLLGAEMPRSQRIDPHFSTYVEGNEHFIFDIIYVNSLLKMPNFRLKVFKKLRSSGNLPAPPPPEMKNDALYTNIRKHQL